MARNGDDDVMLDTPTYQRFQLMPRSALVALRKRFGDSGGVFVVRCLDLAGREEHLRRLIGLDKAGILHIGAARGVVQGIQDLRDGLLAAYGRPGDGGFLFPRPQKGPGSRLSSAARQKFPLSSLVLDVFAWTTTQTAKSWYSPPQHAALLLELYAERYGEPPPLNDTLPRPYGGVPSGARLLLTLAPPPEVLARRRGSRI